MVGTVRCGMQFLFLRTANQKKTIYHNGKVPMPEKYLMPTHIRQCVSVMSNTLFTWFCCSCNDHEKGQRDEKEIRRQGFASLVSCNVLQREKRWVCAHCTSYIVPIAERSCVSILRLHYNANPLQWVTTDQSKIRTWLAGVLWFGVFRRHFAVIRINGYCNRVNEGAFNWENEARGRNRRTWAAWCCGVIVMQRGMKSVGLSFLANLCTGKPTHFESSNSDKI